MKRWFVWGSVGLFAAFLVAVADDYRRGEWRTYQSRFTALALEKKTDPAARKTIKSRGYEIEQIQVTRLGRVDRCMTCHQGLKDPDFADAPQPHLTHPGYILKTNAAEQFGCTVCHHGQGLATQVKAAHGDVRYWDQPMLRKPYLEATCAKCHMNPHEIGGTEVWQAGVKHFRERGCIGCHAVDGFGGKISVELGEVADKPVENFDFMHVPSSGAADRHAPPYKTTSNYLVEHFLAPQALIPQRPELGVPYPSPMPSFKMERAEAEALTAVMLSFTAEKKRIPREMLVTGKGEPLFWTDRRIVGGDPVARGKMVYEKYGCLGCHGAGGAGWEWDGKGIPNYNAQGGRAPGLVNVAEGFTPEELKDKIRLGVRPEKADPAGPTPPLWMQKFGERMSERELDDVAKYLMSLAPKKKEEAW